MEWGGVLRLNVGGREESGELEELAEKCWPAVVDWHYYGKFVVSVPTICTENLGFDDNVFRVVFFPEITSATLPFIMLTHPPSNSRRATIFRTAEYFLRISALTNFATLESRRQTVIKLYNQI